MQNERMKLVAIAAMLLFAISIPLVHSESIDEQQTIIEQAYAFLPGEGKAQVFRVDDPWLWKVEFYYDPGDCNILYAWIDTDFNGSNGNLTWHIFDTSSWTAGWHAWNIRTLDQDIELTPGNAYVLHLFPPIWSTNPKWYGSTSEVYYDGRAYYINETGEHPLDTVDYAFMIYTDVAPVANFSYNTENLTLYVNASTSYVPDGDDISTYEWDWDGDGTYEHSTTEETFNHTYASAGTYMVRLRVTDEDGHNDTFQQQISVSTGGTGADPIANFTAYTDGMTVYVNASGSTDSDGNITTYMWDWNNDGYFDSTYDVPTASHTYTTNGTKTILLRVVDNDGNSNETTRNVTVEPAQQGGGWFTWKLPFSYFAMFLIIAVAIIGFAVAAFFLKPESIKALGYAPAAGSIFATIFILAAVIAYHADIAWYWTWICLGGAILVIYLTMKIMMANKRRRAIARKAFRSGRRR